MTITLEQALEIALELSADDRVALATALLESVFVDGPEDDPAETEAAWEEELKRRMEDLDSGRVEAIPAEEVVARVRARLQQIRDARVSAG